MQGLEGLGQAGRAVQRGDRGIEGVAHAGLARGLGERRLQHERLLAAHGRVARRSCRPRAAANCSASSEQRSALPIQQARGRPQQLRVFAHRDRKALIVVGDVEAALGAVELRLQIARLQHLAVLVAEHRQGDLAADAPGACLPVDVEEGGIGAEPSPLQDVQPPGVVRAHAHVVGHEVEQEPHVVGVQLGDQGIECRLVAELGVEPVEVDHVVAVGRAGPRHGERRGVEVADPERGEIRHDPARVARTRSPCGTAAGRSRAGRSAAPCAYLRALRPRGRIAARDPPDQRLVAQAAPGSARACGASWGARRCRADSAAPPRRRRPPAAPSPGTRGSAAR